jgi:hypothetical protein
MAARHARPIRYAVVGLGHIAQVAVLPAFAHARRNSRLVAVVSDDRTKRREIARRYLLEHAYRYQEYEECLRHVDAVYTPCRIRSTRSTRSGLPGRGFTCSARSPWR